MKRRSLAYLYLSLRQDILSFRYILLISIALISARPVSAQFNMLTDKEGKYCSRQKSRLDQSSAYYTPDVLDPLLDGYDVKFFFLDIAVENNSVYISGNVTTKARAVVPLDTFAFELISQMEVDSVRFNGILHPFTRSEDMGYVPLDDPIPPGNLFSVRISYHGTPPTGGFFTGVSTAYSPDWDKNVTWTLSEPYAAKEWWPTKQDLEDKADSAWVFLTTSDTNLAGSEGLLTAVVPLPGKKVRFEWKSRYPIAYYLISFAVADYQDYSLYAYPETGPDSLLIQNYIYDSPGCLASNKADIDRTADFITLFSNLYGPYPFPEEKYGHCLSEMGGAMEHQTMTTIGHFGYGIVAHELGHMWFGDHVTCATWSDIYINEGFATYSDYLAHHFLSTPYYDSLWLKINHDYVKSEPGGSVWVPPDQTGDVYRIFDGRLSYSKGALLNHMIRFELQDDDLFFDILKAFQAEYADSVATGLNFRDVLENLSGMDFHGFFDQWYFGEGYPVYDINWFQENDTLFITSLQTASTSITPLFKMHVPYYVKFIDGSDSTLVLYQGNNLENYSIGLEKSIETIQVDPGQWILHKLNSIHNNIEDLGNPLHFTLGPNPARDNMILYFSRPSKAECHYKILDLEGRILTSGNKERCSGVLDVSSLAGGMYLFRVDDGKNSFSRKFIKY